MPELVVEGLGEGDARALLDAVLPGPLDARVRDRIVSETRGNPLALLELVRGYTPAELAGGFGLPGGVPLSSSIEESFRRQLDALPAETRRLLQLAAADPVGEPSLVWRAAERLGIRPQAATPAAEAGLLEFGARVRFRHPLVRSAAYGRRRLRRGMPCTARLRRSPIPRSIPTAALGTGPRRRRSPTSRPPRSSSARPIVREHVGASPRRLRSSSARRR